MMMYSSEIRISIPIYHDNDDDDELQRPTMMNDDHRAPTQKWLLPMVGIWNYYFETTTTTNNDNRNNDVDTMNVNTRDYCYNQPRQRGSNHRNNYHGIHIRTTSSHLRRKTIYRPKRRRLLLVPEQLYIILLMILLFEYVNVSIGFTISNHNNNPRRYSQQISTRTITLDNVDDRATPIDTRNRNNPNNESSVTTNVHPNNAVSLLFQTTTMNHHHNKNQRTKSIHSRIRMIHHALRQTSRVTTAAVLAAVCTTTTTDIPPTITEETVPLPPEEEEHDPPSIAPPATTQKSIIKTTIDSVLLRSQQRQQQQRMNPNQNDDISFLQPPIPSIPSLTTNIVFDPNTNDLLKTAAFSTTDHHSSSSRYQPVRMKPQMGIIINDDHAAITDSREKSSSTISLTSQTGISKQLHPDILIYDESIDTKKQRHTITKVRFATPQDDMDVAYLRMSVFADMNTNTVDLIRSQFCTRSCQAIASRRLRGAICFVATTTTTTSTTTTTTMTSSSVPQSQFAISPYNHNNNIDEVDNDPIEIVVGSIECSYHEFFHTRLGSCRKQRALLYITEVAVHSSVRRRGIGTKLLTAVDRYAAQLRQQFLSDDVDDDSNNNNIIESLYLHVDVSNVAAIQMYEQCGYYKVLSNDPMYTEFTTGLNLHPGATRGREHYLMCKNLVTNPVWLSSQQNIGSAMSRNDTDRQHQQRHPILSRLGIEIPA